MIHAHIAVLHN